MVSGRKGGARVGGRNCGRVEGDYHLVFLRTLRAIEEGMGGKGLTELGFW